MSMPIAARLRSSLSTFSLEKTIHKPKTVLEERWWFPAGSITRVGVGIFRWHCIGSVPETERCFIFSGRLDVYDGVGHRLDEDMDEGEVDEDPMQGWFHNLSAFPYAHLFYDTSTEGLDIDLGPWFCIHGHCGKTRNLVEMYCSPNRDKKSDL